MMTKTVQFEKKDAVGIITINRPKKNNTINALKSATGYIKKLIGKHLKLRYTPDLEFREDVAIKRAQGIYRILEGIKKERKNEHNEHKDSNK